MPQYLSPGVYVEDVPSTVKAIAGIGTSTVGFIGVVPETIEVPEAITNDAVGVGDGKKKTFELTRKPVAITAGSFQARVNGAPTSSELANAEGKPSTVTFATAPPSNAHIAADYIAFTVVRPVAGLEAKLCTTFSEFKKSFGDFSTNTGHRNLAHAVFGFFNNGGTRCFVVRIEEESDIEKALLRFEAIDEIAIVAAPGLVNPAPRASIDTHCRQKTQDRFAIFDSSEVIGTATSREPAAFDPQELMKVLPANSDFAAFYFPWIQVFDPVVKLMAPAGDGLVFVPPSGHIAGIYARVDTTRGVHKAPANEPVLGVLGLKYAISKSHQDGLNPQGVNCLRAINGNIRVWGARTIGGNANGDLKYINVRRTLLFLRESIDEGTQFVVFEPNTPALWQQITRNVTAFLTNVWRSGALFGNTPQQAFFVKCDAETNPPEIRELGQVVTEIGVAIVRPAEFVIFRISQNTAAGV